MLIVVLVFCVLLWVIDYLIILLFLVVVGVGYSMVQLGGSKLVLCWFVKIQLGFVMGICQVGLLLGGVLFVVLLLYLVGIYGWCSVFFVGGLVVFFGVLVFMFFYCILLDVFVFGVNFVECDLGVVVKLWLVMIIDLVMKNIVCFGVVLILVQYGILVFIVFYLYEILEIGIGMVVILLFVVQGSGVVGCILLVVWSDCCCVGCYFLVMVCFGVVIFGLLVLVLLFL